MDTEAGAPDNTEIQQLLSLLMLFYKLKPGTHAHLGRVLKQGVAAACSIS